MELYARQQFDLMLREAAGNYAERCVHRAGGPDAALALLREDPGSAVLGRAEFVAAVLSENLLDSRVGRAIRALRGGSVAAEAFGVDTARAKLIVFVYAALLAGGASTSFLKNAAALARYRGGMPETDWTAGPRGPRHDRSID